MTVTFDLVENIFQNISGFKTSKNILKYEPINELIRIANNICRDLREVDDENARRCGYSIWRLKTSAVHSLRPFNCSSLALDEQVGAITSAIGYFPNLLKEFEEVREIIDFLIKNVQNPKRDAVFNLLSTVKSGGRGAGMVTKFSRIPTPAWSPTIESEIKEATPDIEFISSKEKLKRRCFTKIILTAGIPKSDLLPYLYLGYRTQLLNIIAYERENLSSPSAMKLPSGSKIRIKSVQIAKDLSQPEPDRSDVISEDWINREFWDHMRRKEVEAIAREAHGRDHQFKISSRPIALGTRKRVFLRDDQRVLEISEMVDGDANVEDVNRRLPRKLVSELREGDLIVLRTSGSGEYLVEAADALMAEDGKDTLRESALDWKHILSEALQDHGSKSIADRLKSKGHEIRDHNYIWVWTTDIVMRPEYKSRFHALLEVLNELGFSLNNEDVETIADSRWSRMREVQSYHFKAGNLIRELLLTEIRKLIKKDVQIGDQHSLALPGADAGEMTIFRISGVDSEIIELPYARVGIIMPLEE